MLSTDVEEFKRERPDGVILQEGACRFLRADEPDRDVKILGAGRCG